ncbi:MAG: hypothetical protein EHM48_02585 [Planctomycetaceae bacterium]|nr:MAG: hypothetical protein EHM48_02585 [Planctomycetaceae bacterium]
MFKPAGHNQTTDDHGYIIEQPVTLTIPVSSRIATRPADEATTAPADVVASLRPADDMSADELARRKAGAKPSPVRSPDPANPAVPTVAAPNPPAAATPAAGANPDYREVGFDALKRGTQGLDAFKGTPIAVRGRVGENVDRYLLDNAPGDKYVGIKLAEGGKPAEAGKPPKRYIYIYVAKNSPLLAELQKRQNAQGNPGGRYVKLAGRAYFAGNMPDDCPVCIIAEKVVQ